MIRGRGEGGRTTAGRQEEKGVTLLTEEKQILKERKRSPT